MDTRMGIIRPMDTPGMSVVVGGRRAGGSLVTTGIGGRIDIIGRMDITATGELGFLNLSRQGGGGDLIGRAPVYRDRA